MLLLMYHIALHEAAKFKLLGQEKLSLGLKMSCIKQDRWF